MNDRAALYTVAVRQKSKRDQLPLGDIDGAGTTLIGALGELVDGFVATSADGRVVRALTARRDGDDLFVVLQHGAPGVAADIVGVAGEVRLRQTPADTQLIRAGCLFRLPAAAQAGTLVLQVTNGRGVKERFEQGLVAAFRARFPQLRLVLDPLAEPNALRDAVAGDRIEKVQLIRREVAGKRRSAAAGKWVAPGEAARVEVDVAAGAPGARLQRALLERYLAGDQSAFAQIVEFAGMTFDRARVGVRLPDQTRRLFDLAHPDAGPPLRRDLPGLELDEAGEPTEASLLAALRAVI